MKLNLANPRLTPAAKAILQKLNERSGEVIQSRYQPEIVILFGSYAHGKEDEWSDLDLLLVSPHFASMPDLHRRSTFLIETGLVRDKELFVEPLCVTPEEFARSVRMATIQREALRTGIVLLDRLGLTDKVFVKKEAV